KGGADVSLPAGTTWNHPLQVDPRAELVVTGVTAAKGAVSGTGTLTSGAGDAGLTIAAGASIAPGDGTDTPGRLTSAGDVTFQPGSAFRVRVIGPTPAAGYGQLDAGNSAVALAGNLEISRDPAYNRPAYFEMPVLMRAS